MCIYLNIYTSQPISFNLWMEALVSSKTLEVSSKPSCYNPANHENPKVQVCYYFIMD